MWDGPESKDRAACLYHVDFQCKPAPAEALNSLESGRLFLQLDVGGGVRSVSAKMINNAKRENLGRAGDAGEVKRKTLISAVLVQDRHQTGRWAGELSIPSNWMEGGTRTYERTGAASPKSEKHLYTLEITYTLESGNSCTARFGSEDAFHWQARPGSPA